MKPGIVADEMFPEGTNAAMDMEDEAGSNVMYEMNEKHMQDFFNDFEDLNNDEEF